MYWTVVAMSPLGEAACGEELALSQGYPYVSLSSHHPGITILTTASVTQAPT